MSKLPIKWKDGQDKVICRGNLASMIKAPKSKGRRPDMIDQGVKSSKSQASLGLVWTYCGGGEY